MCPLRDLVSETTRFKVEWLMTLWKAADFGVMVSLRHEMKPASSCGGSLADRPKLKDCISVVQVDCAVQNSRVNNVDPSWQAVPRHLVHRTIIGPLSSTTTAGSKGEQRNTTRGVST